MLEILNKFNFVPPVVKEWENENVEVAPNDCGLYELFVDDIGWMGYDYETHYQAAELFSHYSLAKGHCICTGMGLGTRENWLLTKKEVTKVTIIEKNEKVLEYHKYLQSPFLQHCEVIIGDASEYFGKCDSLLLDHYADYDDYKFVFDDVRTVCRNIESETMWFWPLEKFIINYRVFYNERFGRNPRLKTIYQDIKSKNMLDNLPDLDDSAIELYCFMFSFKDFLQGKCMHYVAPESFF